MAFVLDTNVYIEVERNNQKVIGELQKLIISDIIFITTMSYSEIYYGLLVGKQEELKEKADMLNKIPLLNTTKNSSKLFSEIKCGLEKKGKIIPLFDILIASITIDSGMTLLTTDEHFKQIPELKVIILKP
ncbi:type II toxin-antitoxin system VapC family toxin [Candidatus Woesearchaeota archaeon]|nr:type II toxin-antitoxin system VapC family toxin [Candidatus Woesearchaeota archaeon]